IGKQILPFAMCTVEIVANGTRRLINNTALFVQRHAAPVIGSAQMFPGGTVRPGIKTELAGVRYSMKYPAQLAGHYIISTYMPRRSIFRLIYPGAHDQ